MAETGYKFKQGAGGFPPELADRLNETGIGSLFTPLKSEEFTKNGKTFIRFPEPLYARTLGLYRPDKREIVARPPAVGAETFTEEAVEPEYQNTLAHEYIHDAIAQTDYMDSLKNLKINKITDPDNEAYLTEIGRASKTLANMGRRGALIIEEVLATALGNTFEDQVLPSTGIPDEGSDTLSEVRYRLDRYNLKDDFKQKVIDDIPFLLDHFSTHMLKQQAKPSGEMLKISEAPNYK